VTDPQRVAVATVEVDAGSINRTGDYNLVVGGIWLRADRGDFPETGWVDFPVVVLGWWVEAASRLRAGASDREVIDFMEGPYHVEVSSATSSAWRLATITGSRARQPVDFVYVDSTRLVDSVREGSSRLIGICRQRGWESADTARLERSVTHL
jgi:hypothetical protein